MVLKLMSIFELISGTHLNEKMMLVISERVSTRIRQVGLME